MPVTKGRPQSEPESEPEPAPGAVPAGDFQPVGYEGQVVVDESESVSDNTSKSVEDIAKEVIAGHWGRGNRCKERLQKAGYDVAAVREEVSKIFNQ